MTVTAAILLIIGATLLLLAFLTAAFVPGAVGGLAFGVGGALIRACRHPSATDADE